MVMMDADLPTQIDLHVLYEILNNTREDVIVIGSGLAGLSAAYAAANEGKQVAVFSAYKNEKASSWKAKGGIAFPIGNDDSAKLHVEDTLRTGKGLCDETAVKFIISKSKPAFKNLIDLGIEFDLDENGDIDLGLEGGHSRNRVLHMDGDNTGKELSEFMLKIVKEKDVHFFKNSRLLEILGAKDSAEGAIFSIENELKVFNSNAVIISTGGYSSLFEKTTNSEFSLGQGISAARKKGALLSDLEFVQFHPTAMTDSVETFLVTESVRGEEGKIVDENGKQIVNELATRDEASRMIYNHMLKGRKAFIDVRHLGKEFIRKRFPSFYGELSRKGISPDSDLVPIEPAAHYTIGGIKTDIHARASIRGLFSAGEAACSGLHGANRLPCNSLLEALVMGIEAGKNASREMKKARREKIKINENNFSPAKDTAVELKKIKHLMWQNCGIVRNAECLQEAIAEVKKTKNEDAKMLTLLILESALKREESRGVHYRSDFPKEEQKWKKHIDV